MQRDHKKIQHAQPCIKATPQEHAGFTVAGGQFLDHGHGALVDLPPISWFGSWKHQSDSMVRTI
jgi:hypothetical protein